MGNFIGEILIGIGFLIIFFGFIGLLRYHKFYQRLLVRSLIDTSGAILVIVGIIVRQGFGCFSLKTAIIGLVLIIINPLITHKLGRAAFLSGHRE